MHPHARSAALAVLTLLALAPAAAARSTVCTITVNSPDEREVLRQSLPPERFDFVELVERGRRDWLDAACRRHVRCDVLVVSGHFAGTEFYSSRHDAPETLSVDEMERVQCSGGCPGLFGQLREVYLFGCDSLKPVAVTDHGEASRDLMQRIFAGVPVIYGFAALAPYGRVAGPMLQRHLEAHAADFGSGQPSAALLRRFGPASMVATAGLEGAAALAARAASCRFHDQRMPPAERIAVLHQVLAGDAARIPGALERLEKLAAALVPDADADPPAALALARYYHGEVKPSHALSDLWRSCGHCLSALLVYSSLSLKV